MYTHIKERCYNPKDDSYQRYGGRGITMCDEWKDDFEAFCEWSLKNGYDAKAPFGKCTIDRIDNDKGYSPDNCRWVDRKQQARNRSDNVKLTLGEKTLVAADWADMIGMKKSTLLKRLSTGWSVEDALLKPIALCKSRTDENEGVKKLYYTPKEVATMLGIGLQTVYSLLESRTIPAVRTKSGWKIFRKVFHEWMVAETWRQTNERRRLYAAKTVNG